MAEQARGNHVATSSDQNTAYRRGWIAVVLLVCVLMAGCESDSLRPHHAVATEAFDPEQRAVRIETTGCGYASGHTGSGVAIGGGMIVTVAHLLVRAEDVTAYMNGRQPEKAVVAAVDLERDLAILRLTPTGIPDVEVTTVGTGTQGHIVGGAASGTVSFEVTRVVDLTIEEILGTERHNRLGYELQTFTGDGDSGAGAYDEANRLIGIVFATGPNDETTWLTASSEIVDFLDSVGTTDIYELCL